MATDPAFGPTGKIAQIHTGRLKPFEVAVSGGFTNSAITFPDAKLSSTGRFGWSAGLTAQYNTRKNLGFRVGAFYETSNSFFPDQTDLFGSALKYNLSAVEVPATVIIQNNDPSFRIYLGMGANARYVLNSSLDNLNYKTTDLQWGLHCVFGMKIGHVFFEDYIFSNFSDLFDTPAGDPKAKLSVSTFKIGWTF